ncbi:MAG: lipocalin [Betaproteobacteria bacterium]|nr:lipocalin [Betaproteobacteria bacterium]NBS47664.1 lipocalin [Betaproteobacteria bacterium]
MPHAALPSAAHALRALLLAFALGTGLAGGAGASERAPLATIDRLDVPRYMGTWHEIAKYPNWFQRRCVADTSARYTLQADGTVQVLNRCRREDGSFDQALGQARQIGAADSPRLQVRFAPAWLSLVPLVWGDYWVIDLDADYQLVAVSEPRREYLWILSRTPQVDAARYDALVQRLARMGFDIHKLDRTRQASP